MILDEGLQDQNGVGSPTYKQWGQYWPNDNVRKVIQGIITAVCALHEENKFHGGLDHLENYGLRLFLKATPRRTRTRI